jgi:Zn-dependent protease/predicted transcriptional regulator
MRRTARPGRREVGGISAGALLGVRIRLHGSWFVVFALLVLFIATSDSFLDPSVVRGAARWAVAVVVALLFVGSVLFHELAHALVARRRGLRVTEITLFIFGGAANLEQDPPDARTEALVAGVGPLSSLVAAGAFLLASLAFQQLPGPVAGVAGAIALWLAASNLMLALFNIVPGFPMDGGRVLRATLWGLTGDFVRATRWATRVGRGLAWLLVGAGILFAAFAAAAGDDRALVNGVWLALIGWFLKQAAESSYRRVAVEKLVEGLRVAEAMERDVAVVQPTLTLDTLADQHRLRGGVGVYPVTNDGLLVGTVSMARVRRVPRRDWSVTRVAQVMDAPPREDGLTEEEPLWEAVMRFEETGATALPVVDRGDPRHLRGLVTREGVGRALRTHAHPAPAP